MNDAIHNRADSGINMKYAHDELRRLAKQAGDRKKQEKVNRDILDIVRLFVFQKNDGQTMLYIMNVVQRLLSFKPLSPIVGTPIEWNEPEVTSDGHRIYQNKRCLSVFKVEDKDGRVVDQYDTDAIVCSDDGGMSWFTTPKLVRKVRFPYAVPEAPENVYVKEVNGAYQIVNDPEEIRQMYENAVARKKILDSTGNVHD